MCVETVCDSLRGTAEGGRGGRVGTKGKLEWRLEVCHCSKKCAFQKAGV